ncbi:MAG: bis(5'-nucleosyl)-tetraphosphatase (symmetrical) YqeK [Clostridia bacterium]|nr:bis(5'-nucleosyl)-tetraphosphatase (symmetrical) YqeK [Clostridia bacterium]
MYITEKMLEQLRASLKSRLSEKRYLHTLGVEETSVHLGKMLLPSKLTELRAAALLHDVAKEYQKDELLLILRECEGVTRSDLDAPPAYHAFCAPVVIKRDFGEFATEEILSAVFKHTTADENMSTFDKIIFIADYIEPGRKYYQCVSLRDWLTSSLNEAKSEEERQRQLDRAVLLALENTVKALGERGDIINERTLKSKAALMKILGN